MWTAIFTARGETAEEVLQKCAEHAREEHDMDELSPELQAKVRAAIRDEGTTRTRGATR